VPPAIRHSGVFHGRVATLEIVWRFLLVFTVIDHVAQPEAPET
jgi:hypothetical protein